jgi:polysaccharide biosynthesis/export protein
VSNRSGPYLIQDGDLLDVRVYNEAGISTRSRVRDDGSVTISLIGDVTARGKTPQNLAGEVQTKLQQFLQAPSVAIVE